MVIAGLNLWNLIHPYKIANGAILKKLLKKLPNGYKATVKGSTNLKIAAKLNRFQETASSVIVKINVMEV